MNNNEEELVSDYTRARYAQNRVVVEVAQVDWLNPSQLILTWHSVFELPANSNAEEIEAARHKLLRRKKYFKICQECEERQPTGHMWSTEMCQSCASNNLGIIF